MEPTPHLDHDMLAAYVDGRLAVAELGQADRHIDACGSCRRELSTLAAMHTLPVAPDAPAPEGSLGRYHVLRELGRGSMGIVLRAFDPELARPVAIKLLRELDADTRELLRREARALAKLRHPNVVTVYDVIIEDGAMYVAMELVDGDTLRGFCRGRGAGEILAACIKAGRGLAAAHDAGVIHRDFKPENVLCTDTGEVRVSDFGLARAADDGQPEAAIAGTPAYMAPEILRREPATAASDQYSFAVTVYEMLTGARPVGDALASDAMPAWVWRVLRRALERDAAARFPSMHAVVAALENDPGVRRRKRALLAAGALVALATGALAVKLASSPSAAGSCAIDDNALGDAWQPARRREISEAITTASGSKTAAIVTAALDDYAGAWLASRRDACGIAQHNAALGRWVACLDRSRRELGEVARVLATADAKVAGAAIEAIGRLRDPSACSAAGDAQEITVDAVDRVLVEQTRTVLDRASAVELLGKLDEAESLADRVIAQLGPRLPRLVGEALLVKARVETDRGRHDRAEAILFDALHAAERGRDDGLVATIWIEIVVTTGAQQHRFDLAMSNARAADAALARIEASPELHLRYSYALGTLLLAHGKLGEARDRLQAGLALADDEARRRAQIGFIHVALCDVERQADRLAAAHEHCAKGMKLVEAALGPDHVRVAVSLSIVGALAFTEHDLATAERTFTRMVEIFEKLGANDQIAYALALSNLGSVYAERDELDRARSHYERARAMFDAHHPDHPQGLRPLQGLASVALRQNDPTRAIELYLLAREGLAATYAPENPAVLAVDYNLSLAYRSAKRPAEASKVLEQLAAHALTPGKESWAMAARALDSAAAFAEDRKDLRGSIAMRERALAALEHVTSPADVAVIQRHIAQTYFRMTRPDLALPFAEASYNYFEPRADNDYDRGIARFFFAVALGTSKRDVPRAKRLSLQAQEDLAAAKSGPGLAFYRTSVERFIRDGNKKDPKRPQP